MKEIINKFMADRCITATVAIKETGLNRNAFYLYNEKNYPAYKKFMKSHENDFVFTSEGLMAAFKKSGLTQLELSDKLNIHNVTLNLFIHGKLRPSRASGDYDKIRGFCQPEVTGCELGRVVDSCSLAGIAGDGCLGCRYML
jgi:hypothetical protein